MRLIIVSLILPWLVLGLAQCTPDVGSDQNTGTVVNQRQRPVVGASVTAVPQPTDRSVAFERAIRDSCGPAVTDEEGHFRLEVVPSVLYRLVVSHPEFTRCTIDNFTSGQVVQPVLKDLAKFDIVVLDESTNEPIPDANVVALLQRHRNPFGHVFSYDRYETATGRNGRASFSQFSPAWSLNVRATGYAPYATSMETGPSQSHTVKLTQDAHAAHMAIDRKSGEAIQGAEIWTRNHGIVRASTDGQVHLYFQGKQKLPGWVSAPGYQRCSIDIDSESLEVSHILEPGPRIKGTVTDANGVVIPRCRITLVGSVGSPPAAWMPFQKTIECDDQGHFTLDTLGGEIEGSLGLLVEAEGYGDLAITISSEQLPPMNTLALTLTEPSDVMGTVSEELLFDDETPVLVQLEAISPTGGLWNGDNGIAIATQLTKKGSFHFRGLSAGKYRVELYRDPSKAYVNRADARAVFELGPGESRVGQVLSDILKITGRVTWLDRPATERGVASVQVFRMDDLNKPVASVGHTTRNEFRVSVDDEGPYRVVVTDTRNPKLQRSTDGVIPSGVIEIDLEL